MSCLRIALFSALVAAGTAARAAEPLPDVVLHVPLRERAMVPPAPASPSAQAIDATWLEARLPDLPTDAAQVLLPAHYRIRCAKDAAFAAGVSPEQVDHRHFPESARYAEAGGRDAARISVVYRIYLRLSAPLPPHKKCELKIAPAVARVPALPFTLDGAAPNDSLHVNQVGYRTADAKVAYLSAWTGSGSVDFRGAKTFEVIDEGTGEAVFSGPIHLDVAGAAERWSRSSIFSLDFSAVAAEGRYHLHVPGVGRSFSFRIAADAYRQVAYTLVRGLALQRDGDHGLTPGTTHWSRPPAHLDDAIDQQTGAQVDLAGGHMDAGDRGKYPWDSADAAASMLVAIELFPREVQALGESLQLPNSHNGVPDVLDEAAWELDWLAKAVLNTAGEGALAFYLRPQTGGYEQGAPPEGARRRVWFDKTMGPNRAETLYAAGALAFAASSPLFKEHLPAKCATWRKAALRAMAAFQRHQEDGKFWRDAGWYDSPAQPQKWSDELLLAAAGLFRLTGEARYAGMVRDAFPEEPLAGKQWGWKVDVPYLNAFALLARMKDEALGDVPERALKAAVAYGDAALGDGKRKYDAPFGAPLPWQAFQRVGWYFTGSASAFPLMVAYGLSGEAPFRDALVRDWNWLLGTNPLSRTFVSGLGDPQRSPRWMVHELAQVMWGRFRRGEGGWSEPPPGLFSADLQSGSYGTYLGDAWNAPRKAEKFPAQDASYPPLFRYHDSWTVENEATINRQARAALSVLPLIGVSPVVSR